MIKWKVYKKNAMYHDYVVMGLDWYFHHRDHPYRAISFDIIVPYIVLHLTFVYKNSNRYNY